MKKSLRIIAVIILFVTAGFWFMSGANTGWTKTQIPMKTVDEITGIEGVMYQKKFVPGVDFLGAGIAAGIVLIGISFAFKNKNAQQQTS